MCEETIRNLNSVESIVEMFMEGKTTHHALPLGEYREYSSVIGKLVSTLELFLEINLKT